MCTTCIFLVFVMLSPLFVAALLSPGGEGDDLLTLARDVYCDFVAFPFGILGDCIDS